MTPSQRRLYKAANARRRAAAAILASLPKPDSRTSRRKRFLAQAAALGGAMRGIDEAVAGASKREVAIIAHIRNNKTGEVRDFATSITLEAGETIPSTYLWEEGNYSCDCNRHLLFERAAGNEPDNEHPCSDGVTNDFAVNLEDVTTKEIIYREF